VQPAALTPAPPTPAPTNATAAPTNTTAGPTAKPVVSSEDMLDSWPNDSVTMCVDEPIATFTPATALDVVTAKINAAGGGGSPVLIYYCGITTKVGYQTACVGRGDPRADYTSVRFGVIGQGWTTEKTQSLAQALTSTDLLCSGQSPIIAKIDNEFLTQEPDFSFVDESIAKAKSPVGIAVVVVLLALMTCTIGFLVRRMCMKRDASKGEAISSGDGISRSAADTEMDVHAAGAADLQRN
jgi:hypothetical protein